MSWEPGVCVGREWGSEVKDYCTAQHSAVEISPTTAKGLPHLPGGTCWPPAGFWRLIAPFDLADLWLIYKALISYL